MTVRNWFGRVAESARRTRSRLRVEALEGRRVPAVFSVVNVNDSGDGSLRQAILDANAAAGADAIAFAIPGSGVHTIRPTTPLPVVTGSVTMDGYTQPGSSPNTAPPDQNSNAVWAIDLDGSLTGGYGVQGLRFTGGNNVVRGLFVHTFPSNQIEFATNGGNVIEGNKVSGVITIQSGAGNRVGGTAPAARNLAAISLSSDNNVVQGNQSSTVGVSGSHNQIGGTTPAARNVIGGGRPGLYISGSFNTVQGNYIGTDVTGTQKVLNRRAGVFLDYTATENVIGGTEPGAGNVISGNERGVYIFGGYRNTVQGNLIGPNAAGTATIGNPIGVFITVYSGPANENLIGGTAPGAGNVISGNGIGVLISAPGNAVQGNLIGTLADGVTPAGNTSMAIDLYGGSCHDNTIGGTAAGTGNVIANSLGLGGFGGTGVRIEGVEGYNPSRNAVLGNSIYGNAGLGIDLTNDPNAPGVTPNDAGDGDAGANGLQNFPVLKDAALGGGHTTVRGTLNSTPNGTFRVEFFASPAADPSGYGEGTLFLGAAAVATDASGNATFTAVVAAAPAGWVVSATATDTANNTSEFSAGVTAARPRLPPFMASEPVSVARPTPGGAPPRPGSPVGPLAAGGSSGPLVDVRSDNGSRQAAWVSRPSTRRPAAAWVENDADVALDPRGVVWVS